MQFVNWTDVQRRLHKLGFNPGPLDGVRGRLTTNAVRLFQESHGLVADGIVGPATHAALFGAPTSGQTPVNDEMPWFQEALRLVGTQEVGGSASSPVIMTMAVNLGVDSFTGDDVPWCGLFVGHCIGATLPMEGLPGALLRARAWDSFGMKCEPQLGAVMVFWRDGKSSGKGHVGFYHGEDADAYHILGGNQGDTVSVRRFDRERLLTARWPLTSLLPAGKVVIASNVGAFSTNEA